MKRVTILLVLAISLHAQSDPTKLTLDRIFASREFSSKYFGPAKWLEQGTAYTTVEASADGSGSELIRYETETGARSVWVSTKTLTPAGDTQSLAIADYEWSADRTTLLIFTNTRRVWRYNTRGDYWVLNLKTGALMKLGGPDAAESTLMFAKFSPDSRSVAYVRENNIYVEQLADHRITALTGNGTRTLINGTFDWVYEEEFDLRDGFRWSPDSKNIAYWQLDASGVRDFLMINNTDSVYSRIIPVQYPKAGELNSACRIGVVSATGGETKWMNIEGDPRNTYLNGLEWAGSDRIAIRHMNRLQNTCRLLLGDPATGAVTDIFTDTDSAWIDATDFQVLRGGQEFLWLSERDGWRHVYRITRAGAVTCLTPGNYDVATVEAVDEKQNTLYFTASPDHSAYRFLYSVKMDGKGKFTKLTPASRGYHSYQISPSGRYAIHTGSVRDRAGQIELIELPKHRVLRVLEDNADLNAKLSQLAVRPTEYFRVDAGSGFELDGWIMKPVDFDSSKKYPVLFHVYGEPAAQTVIDRFGGSGHLWHWMLTQQGYVVVSVDCRGTPALRGRAWRKSIYKNIGYLGPIDVAGAAERIRRWSFVDSTRIGIWGWSGGGSSTLHAMFRWPDLYQAGISIAPVTDSRFYDNIYTERYMGLPQENADFYKRAATLTYAHQLKGRLLLIHGTGDDNVHYQNAEAVINALIAANRTFDLMSYPNRSHGIYEGKGTTLHLRTLMTEFLHRHLPPGGR